MKQLYFAAMAGYLSMLSIGQFYGWASPTLPKLENDTDAEYPVHLTPAEASWIAALFSLGAPVGAILCALIINVIGRKYTMLFAAVPSIIGWLMIIFATSSWELYVSRLISGIGVGLTYISTPLYLSEISPSKIRGILLTVMEVSVNIGLILQYVIGPFLSVKNHALVSLVAPCLFVITFIWVPESPYYLMRINASQKVLDSLVRLRGVNNVYKEADIIEQSVKADLGAKSSFLLGMRDLLVPSNFRSITIITCLGLLQQASGILPIVSYSEKFFNETRITLEGKYLTMILGAVQIISMIVCAAVIDCFGRRSLLIISCVGVACTIGLVATYFTLQYYDVNTSEFAWLPAVGLLSYIAMYSVGFTPLLLTLCSEVLPMSVKAFGGMMVLVTVTLTSFVMTKLYAVLAESVGAHVPMWIFCVCGFLGALLTYFYIPETKGKTLEEIQEKFGKTPNFKVVKNVSKKKEPCQERTFTNLSSNNLEYS